MESIKKKLDDIINSLERNKIIYLSQEEFEKLLEELGDNFISGQYYRYKKDGCDDYIHYKMHWVSFKKEKESISA